MATEAKKGKRRSTAKPVRPKGPKPPRRVRAKLATSKRTKLAGATSSRRSASRPRAGRAGTAKGGSKSRFQRRRVVIRFRDGFDEKREQKELTVRYGRIVLRPVFITSRSAVERLQARARKQNPEYSLPDFRNYYFMYLRPGRKPADVARELLERPTVGFAYEDAPTKPANPQPSTYKCSLSSRHFEGAGEGVNARSAWALPGGKGDGQLLVDVERGWTPEHTRLPTSRINLLVGKSLFGERAHGTSVLGIVCGQHTQAGGCEGIAPNVASVGLASTAPDANAPASAPRLRHDDAATALKENVYDALGIGIHELVQRHASAPQNGYGVLLLEHQTEKGLPLETYEGIHALLRLASEEYNITVVEAAGNAQADLDAHPDAQILQQDSGAIVVGSARKEVNGTPAPDHHKRFHSSNFGHRVNCYAWGERVMTPAWLSGQPNTVGILNQCDDQFGHTSAAAAIIAGVALVVQGVVAHSQPPLTASQLRAILTNPALGTPCATGDQIGVMPDLGRIAPTL